MYELQRPTSDYERMNFIAKYIYKEGLRYEITDRYFFALEKNEIMGEKEIEIEIPDYDDVEETIEFDVLEYETIEEEYEAPALDEDGNQIYDTIEKEIEVPTTKTEEQEIEVPAFDEEGNPILDEEGNQTYKTETQEVEVIVTEKQTQEVQVPRMETKTREVTVPKMIAVEETIIVPDYDEEGNQTGEHEETITKQVQASHKETRAETVTKQVGSHTETIVIPYPIINPNYEQEEAARIREELDAVTLTPSDVERALYYGLGMDFDDLKALIAEQAPTIDLKGLAIEFRANNFYRGAVDKNGNRIVDMVGLLLGYTPADMDYLFEHKELPKK